MSRTRIGASEYFDVLVDQRRQGEWTTARTAEIVLVQQRGEMVAMLGPSGSFLMLGRELTTLAEKELSDFRN